MKLLRTLLFFLLAAAGLNAQTISQLSPSYATAGTGAFTLTVTGGGFHPGSTVTWNGTNLTTTFVAANEVTAAVPAVNVATMTTAKIGVVGTTVSIPFVVYTPLANITSYTPNFFNVGVNTPVDVHGGPFAPNATILFDLQAVTPTTVVSSSEVKATISGSLIYLSSAQQAHHVYVYNGAITTLPTFFNPSAQATPTTVAFGSITQGTPGYQTTTVSGLTGITTITTMSITGTNSADFVVGPGSNCNSALLQVGQTCIVQVIFTPSTTSSETATLTIGTAGSPLTVALTGTGSTPITPPTGLMFYTPSPNFGAVTTGSRGVITVSITAGYGVTIVNSSSWYAISGTNAADFFLQGSSTCQAGLTIPVGGSCTLVLWFVPTTTAAETASIAISSTATNSPMRIPLTGTGSSATAHTVTVSWTASVSTNLVGYNIYRSTTSGGPYTKITSTPVSGTSYTDTNVTAGTTYYYVVTSVGTTAYYTTVESLYSNQTSATP